MRSGPTEKSSGAGNRLRMEAVRIARHGFEAHDHVPALTRCPVGIDGGTELDGRAATIDVNLEPRAADRLAGVVGQRPAEPAGSLVVGDVQIESVDVGSTGLIDRQGRPFVLGSTFGSRRFPAAFGAFTTALVPGAFTGCLRATLSRTLGATFTTR